MAIEMYLHLNNVHEVGAFIEINLRNHTIPEEQQININLNLKKKSQGICI